MKIIKIIQEYCVKKMNENEAIVFAKIGGKQLDNMWKNWMKIIRIIGEYYLKKLNENTKKNIRILFAKLDENKAILCEKIGGKQ